MGIADCFVDSPIIGVWCVDLVGEEIVVAERIALLHKGSGHYRIALRRIRRSCSAPLVRPALVPAYVVAALPAPTWQRSHSCDLLCELARGFDYASQQCSQWVTLRA